MIAGWLDGVDALVALVTATAMGLIVRVVLPPTPRLAGRLRPYTMAARSSLGRSPDVLAARGPQLVLSGRALRQLLTPVVGRAAMLLGRVVDRSGEETVLLRLRQADLLRDIPESQRLQEHRVRQLQWGAAHTAALVLPLLMTGIGAAGVLLLALVGFVAGVARWRARIERGIRERRDRMRIELYTVNQLLAMNVRVGGGVVQAIAHIVERGQGAVVDEFTEVLRMHRGGMRVADALTQAVRTTCEPNAARTYKALAAGVEYGTDLASALRGLSEDVRRQRVEALKRAATRRRAAMLVPIIAILAPVMLLFIAAPLPSIVLGGLR